MSLLTQFHEAGLLRPLDFEVATRLGAMQGESNPLVLLAVALASRAPSLGNTCVNLADVPATLRRENLPREVVEQLCAELPSAANWVTLLEESPVVSSDGQSGGPIVLQNHQLYLGRYWSYQRRLADHLQHRAMTPVPWDGPTLEAALQEAFPQSPDDEFDYQRLAAITAVLRNLTVIAGGPGTGKTYTVRRILHLLLAQFQHPSAGGGAPRVALLAPTGKAAARMTEALQEGDDPASPVAALCPAAVTIHRALGVNPARPGRPRHHRNNPLPVDIVVVDEASMIDIAMMTRLLDAVPDTARLILLGDPDQLASVEAGAVLSDLCDVPHNRHPISEGFANQLAAFVQKLPSHYATIASPGIWDCMVRLNVPRRFKKKSGIFACATSVNRQDADEALHLLCDDSFEDIRLSHRSARGALDTRTVEAIVEGFKGSIEAAATHNDPALALERMQDCRLLCAHRLGAEGIEALNQEVERLLTKHLRGFSARHDWYPGRPILITRNDAATDLTNGDMGVVVRAASREGPQELKVAFPPRSAGEPVRLLAPARLPPHETVFAMTIHKSQGSQFRHVIIVLPPGDSPIMTKELLYTAITRAQQELTVVVPATDPKTPHPFRHGINQRIQRLSGLKDLLWREGPSETPGNQDMACP